MTNFDWIERVLEAVRERDDIERCRTDIGRNILVVRV